VENFTIRTLRFAEKRKMKSTLVALSIVALFLACQNPESKKVPLIEPTAIHYDSALKPFYHGVASGDPLPDRIIIWTRVTPESATARVPVKWEMATDEKFSAVAKTDTTSAWAANDYTIKVDVDGLQAGTVYYYRFRALEKNSTKTASTNATDSLKFAIASCSNWEWGYFTPYSKIAERDVLDAVIHLGDYIYEYGTKKYGDTSIGRINIPDYEIVSLQDYRTRYALYRLDKGLRSVHQQHPFITIWDDHEIANNSYIAGAQNHQPEEGDYIKRKEAARKAYYEWLPIREGGKHFRSFSFGSLADVIMLDERLEGRTAPSDSLSDPSFNNTDRKMLGDEQLQWFKGKLQDSKAAWKIIGNQVIYSDVFLKDVYPKTPRNLDAWDGYPAEKKNIRDFIVQNKIQDMVFVTGDTHASWAIEAVAGDKYLPATSKGALAVEFGTTSISSANGDEGKGEDEVKRGEQAVLKSNPHIKYLDNRHHGYLLLTLYPTKTKAEWYYVETVRQPESKEFLGKKFEVAKGSVKLK
jgi:alkaline phosphatase D